MRKKMKGRATGRAETPEDRAWKAWYEKLGVEEHEEYLSKLGLDKEDIEEWEETEGLKKTQKKK
jgi:hypothetical protein